VNGSLLRKENGIGEGRSSISTFLDLKPDSQARLREQHEQDDEFEVFDSEDAYERNGSEIEIPSGEIFLDANNALEQQPKAETGHLGARPLISETTEGLTVVINRIKERLKKHLAAVPLATPPELPVDFAKAGVETYRSQIATAVRTATEKVHRAEESLQKALAQIDAEIAMRSAADEKVQKLEAEFSEHSASVEALDLKRMELEYSLEEVQSRLNAEMELKAALEKEVFEARANSDAMSLKIMKLENSRAKAEEKAAAADRMVREVETMLDQSEALATEANLKFKAIEARLRQERELRQFAEQQLKTLVEEFNIKLDVEVTDLPVTEPLNGSRNGHGALAELQTLSADKRYQQLLSGIDAERRARIEAEKQAKSIHREAAEARDLMKKSEALLAQTQEDFQAKIQAMDAEIRQLHIKLQISEDAAARARQAQPSASISDQMLPAPASAHKARVITYYAGIGFVVMVLVVLFKALLNQL
jgi:hypothetical protein